MNKSFDVTIVREFPDGREESHTFRASARNTAEASVKGQEIAKNFLPSDGHTKQTITVVEN